MGLMSLLGCLFLVWFLEEVRKGIGVGGAGGERKNEEKVILGVCEVGGSCTFSGVCFLFGFWRRERRGRGGGMRKKKNRNDSNRSDTNTNTKHTIK